MILLAWSSVSMVVPCYFLLHYAMASTQSDWIQALRCPRSWFFLSGSSYITSWALRLGIVASLAYLFRALSLRCDCLADTCVETLEVQWYLLGQYQRAAALCRPLGPFKPLFRLQFKEILRDLNDLNDLNEFRSIFFGV